MDVGQTEGISDISRKGDTTQDEGHFSARSGNLISAKKPQNRVAPLRNHAGVTLTPLDIAAETGLLLWINTLPLQQSVNCVPQITSRDRNVRSRTAVVELAAVDQLALVIEKVELGGTNRLVRPCDVLGLVKAERKPEALLDDHLGETLWSIAGVSQRIVGRNGNDAEWLRSVIPTDLCQLPLHMLDVRAVAADEHDKQTTLTGKALERDSIAGADVGKYKWRGVYSQRKHGRLSACHSECYSPSA